MERTQNILFLGMHFLLLCGPPAVGKMTIGREIASRTGFKLFHNHHSIEFALNYFDFGDPEFAELNEGLRQLVFSTVAKSQQLSGFIFTLVWAFNEQEDWDYVRDLVNRFTNNGWTFSVVELYAPLKIRHERNKTPLRLAEKPSKRNIELSADNLDKMDSKYTMNNGNVQIPGVDYFYLDVAECTPQSAADQIIRHFKWPTID